jgi:hypothetical protein
MANESHVFTFKMVGLVAGDFTRQMSSDVAVVVSPQLPQSTIRVQVDADDTVYAARQLELVAAALERGYALDGIDLPNVVPRTLKQSVGSALVADFSCLPADGWKTVLSHSITTRGTTSLAVVASINAAITLGIGGTAFARLFVSGGTWGAGTEIRGGELFAQAPHIAFNHPLTIAPEETDTTITVELQTMVTVVGSELTINAATSPGTCGAALALAEHA